MNHEHVLLRKELQKIIVDGTIKKTLYDAFVYLPNEEPDDASQMNAYIIEKNSKTKIKLLRQLHNEFFTMIYAELEDAIKVRTISLDNIIRECRVDNHTKLNLLKLKMEKIELTGTEQVFNPAKYDDAIKWIYHIIDKMKLKTGFIRCNNRAEDLLKVIYLENNGYPYTE